jgi:hypothetical protein
MGEYNPTALCRGDAIDDSSRYRVSDANGPKMPRPVYRAISLRAARRDSMRKHEERVSCFRETRIKEIKTHDLRKDIQVPRWEAGRA